MFRKTYTVTTTEGKSDALKTKRVKIETSKNNSDELYIALSYSDAGTKETSWIPLGYNEKQFFGAPPDKRITYVLFYSKSGSQSLTVTALDGTLEEAMSKVDIEEAFPYWEVTREVPFVERWEFLTDLLNRKKVFFEKYQGRIGSVWMDEAQLPESAWTLPNIELNVAGTPDPAPWNNVINMDNTKDGSTLNEIYFAVRICYKRARLRIACKMPSGTPASAYLLFGFEVVSQGGHAIAMLMVNNNTAKIVVNCLGEDGTLSASPAQLDVTSGFVFDAWTNYLFEYDPPVVRISKYSAGNYVMIGELIIRNASASDVLMPFFANESTAIVTGYKIGHFAIAPITHSGKTSKIKDFTNPASNPEVTIDTGNRTRLHIWVQSIAGSKTVKLYGSSDRADARMRLIDTLTTDATTKEVQKGYDWAYRFAKLLLEETGTGTVSLEIVSSRGES